MKHFIPVLGYFENAEPGERMCFLETEILVKMKIPCSQQKSYFAFN